MARTDAGLVVLVDAGRLERMDGSVEAFRVELARAAQAVG
jgi:hypothetical protein